MKKYHKLKNIKERVKSLKKSLDNAIAYLERGQNIEGEGFVHLCDWKGNSGHPKWVKNHMMPTIEKKIIHDERIIKILEAKDKSKALQNR